MSLIAYHTNRKQYDDFTEPNMVALAQWAEQQHLPWMWSELSAIAGKTARPAQDHDAIRHGFMTTPTQREKWPFELKFYVAQLTMFDAELKRYRAAVDSFAAATQRFAPDATIFSLHGAVQALLDHGIVLLEQASACLSNKPGVYGAGSRRSDHHFEIFKGAEQIVYGRFSGLTHNDRAPWTPVAVLRTAIEIRLRSAFGIQGYRDLRNSGFVPIDLSQLFEAVRAQIKDIQFDVDFHDVEKIYRWSNFYLHGGWRDFVWAPGFALQYLRPLFVGPTPSPHQAWSIDGGIRMPRATWRAIRTSFEPSPDRSIFMRLYAAIRTAVCKKPRQLKLYAAEETHAACVFLD